MSGENGNSVIYHGPLVFKPVVEKQWGLVKGTLGGYRNDLPVVVAGAFARDGPAIIPDERRNAEIDRTVRALYTTLKQIDGCEGCVSAKNDILREWFAYQRDTRGKVVVMYTGQKLKTQFKLATDPFDTSCSHKFPQRFAAALNHATAILDPYDFPQRPDAFYDPRFDLVVAGGLDLLASAFLFPENDEVDATYMDTFHCWNFGQTQVAREYSLLRGNLFSRFSSPALFAESPGKKLPLGVERGLEKEVELFAQKHGAALRFIATFGEKLSFILCDADEEDIDDGQDPLLASIYAYQEKHGISATIEELAGLLDEAYHTGGHVLETKNPFGLESDIVPEDSALRRVPKNRLFF